MGFSKEWGAPTQSHTGRVIDLPMEAGVASYGDDEQVDRGAGGGGDGVDWWVPRTPKFDVASLEWSGDGEGTPGPRQRSCDWDMTGLGPDQGPSPRRIIRSEERR